MAKRILIVDDEPALLFSLGEFLKLRGYEVQTALDGEKALQALVEAPPDLIIADILMPQMDGFAFQQRVQALTRSSIPFIFLTAKAALTDRLAGLKGGADDYITKPFDPEELAMRVEAVLRRVEQTRLEEQRLLEAEQARLLAEIAANLRLPSEEIVQKLDVALSAPFSLESAEKMRYLHEALQEARTLQQRIQDLSWATAGQRGEPLQKMPQRLAPIVRGAAARVARLAQRRHTNLAISCGGLLTANVDASALTRALSALLEVIIKSSPLGAQVHITATRSLEGGVEIVLSAPEDGAPLPQEEPSETLAPLDALALARQVAQGHGGRFSVRREGGTSHYILWVPGRVVRYAARRR